MGKLGEIIAGILGITVGLAGCVIQAMIYLALLAIGIGVLMAIVESC